MPLCLLSAEVTETKRIYPCNIKKQIKWVTFPAFYTTSEWNSMSCLLNGCMENPGRCACSFHRAGLVCFAAQEITFIRSAPEGNVTLIIVIDIKDSYYWLV